MKTGSSLPVEDSLLSNIGKVFREYYEALRKGEGGNLPLYRSVGAFDRVLERIVLSDVTDSKSEAEIERSRDILRAYSTLQAAGFPLALSVGKLFRAMVGPERFEETARQVWKTMAQSWYRVASQQLPEGRVEGANDENMAVFRFDNSDQAKKALLILGDEYIGGLRWRAMHRHTKEYAEILKMVARIRDRAFPEQSGRAEEVLMDMMAPLVQEVVGGVRTKKYSGKNGINIMAKVKAEKTKIPEILMALWPEIVVKTGIAAETLEVLLTGNKSGEDYLVRIDSKIPSDILVQTAVEQLEALVETKGSAPSWSVRKDSLYLKDAFFDADVLLLAAVDTNMGTVTVGLSGEGAGYVGKEFNYGALTHMDYVRAMICRRVMTYSADDGIPLQTEALLYRNLGEDFGGRAWFITSEIVEGLDRSKGKDSSLCNDLFIDMVPTMPGLQGVGAFILDTRSERCPELFADVAGTMEKLHTGLLITNLVAVAETFSKYSERIAGVLKKSGETEEKAEVGSRVIQLIDLPAEGIVPDMKFAVTVYDTVEFVQETTEKILELAREVKKQGKGNGSDPVEVLVEKLMEEGNTKVDLGMFLVEKDSILLEEPKRVTLKLSLEELLESSYGRELLNRMMKTAYEVLGRDEGNKMDAVKSLGRFAGSLAAFVKLPQVKEKLYGEATQIILEELSETEQPEGP